MEASTENPDDWRRKEIFSLLVRLLVILIPIVGAITAIWLLLAVGIGWLSCSVVVITLLFALLSRFLLLHR